MDYQQILKEIQEEVYPLLTKGKVADYIPALACIDASQFAMSVTLFDGNSYHIGVDKTRFSIQSISKVFTLTHALSIYGPSLYKKVGKEPSGNPFNSLVQLEYENGIPRNPFINAGAIAVTDALLSQHQTQEKTFEHIITLVRSLSDNNSIVHDEEVSASEWEHRDRNLALAHLMKSFSNIDNDAEEVVKTYFQNCSIEMSTAELSRAMLYLANNGTDPLTNIVHITQAQTKRINALMLTCGHYDASGEFAFHVGLPGKSGVGGGIVAIVPNVMSICVFSPGLNDWGNSLVGTKALELFTTKTGHSIF